jgi:hypothetical protein
MNLETELDCRDSMLNQRLSFESAVRERQHKRPPNGAVMKRQNSSKTIF